MKARGIMAIHVSHMSVIQEARIQEFGSLWRVWASNPILQVLGIRAPGVSDAWQLAVDLMAADFPPSFQGC